MKLITRNTLALLLTTLLGGISQNAVAQDSTASITQNAIYGSVSTLGLWFTGSINYERYVFSSDKWARVDYYVRGAGGAFATWGANGPMGIVSLQGVVGKKSNNHLELGLGVAALYDKPGYEIGLSNANFPYPGYEPEPTKWEYTWILPAVTVGYRYQKPDGGFVMRAGLASPDGVYFSLGAAF